MLRHREQLSVCQAASIWPVVRIRLAQDHGDLVELVHLGRAREEWLESIELGHDAAQRKDVDGIVIRSTSKDILGGPVPSRGHILRERRRVPDLFNKSEVA